MSWLRRNARLVGRLLLLLGVVLAGFLANHGYLPQPKGEWREFSVQSLERNSVPHQGKVERSYHLKVVGDAVDIVVEADVSPFFQSQLLLSQTLPASVEVLSNGEPDNGRIRAVGLRLAHGTWLLNPEQVQAARRPFEILGVALCSLVVLAGVALQFLGRRRKT